MKLGVENRKELIVMVVLLAIAVPLVVYQFRDQIFGAAAAAPAVNVPPPTATKTASDSPSSRERSDPRLRLDVLEASRKVKYEAGGRNIFRMEAPPIPKTIAPVHRAEMGPPAPTPPPTPTPPPPIPIVYYGYASRPGETKRVFLQKKGEDEVMVAAQGDIVARRYRVVQIQPNSVTMEDVITSNRQPIPLTAR